MQKNIIFKLQKLFLIIRTKPKNFNVLSEAFVDNGTLINSDFLNGLTVEQAKSKIIKEIEKLKIGKKKLLLD